jgi:sugar lactone lactonase YvrE
MKPLTLIVVAACLVLLQPAAADEAPLIPPDAQPEVVSTGQFKFTEGPALAPDGSIYFTDIPNNAIFRYSPRDGDTHRFDDRSGGANGLMFHGNVLIQCRGGDRTLYAEPISPAAGRAAEGGNVLAKKFEDQRLNSPNDLTISDDGIYFTDPRYGNRDNMEMDVEGVYFVSHGPADQQTVVRVIDDLVKPNGIGISNDQQTLYVNDNGGKKVWAYPILGPGELGEGRVLYDTAEYRGPDGMTVGPRGRIYTTMYGQGVLILSPEGEKLGFLETGPQTTNCVFGADGRTLYVTAEKALKRIVLNTGVGDE